MSRSKKKKKQIVKESSEEFVNAHNTGENDCEMYSETARLMAMIPHDPDFTEKDFTDSVEELKCQSIEKAPTPEEDGENTEKSARKFKKKRSRAENIIELSILSVCAVAVLVCIVMLTYNVWGKIRGAQIYDEAEFALFTEDGEKNTSHGHPLPLFMTDGDLSMLSMYDRIAAGKTPEQPKKNSEYAAKLAEAKASLTALKARNDEVIGWIYIEGTNINHPLMRGSDNEYYLTHAYTGENLPIGSIFMDFTCSPVITDNFNTVIYGHNVTTNAMFHEVTDFLSEETFNKNLIYIYTMDGVYIFKPSSIYTTTSDVQYYKTGFDSEEDFLSFANKETALSQVKSDAKFEKGDKMLTLSTCTNSGNGRYALHAKLIDIIE